MCKVTINIHSEEYNAQENFFVGAKPDKSPTLEINPFFAGFSPRSGKCKLFGNDFF